MLRRPFLWLVASCSLYAANPDEQMFFGSWRDDSNNPNVRTIFRADHSVIVQAGESSVTFLEGRWRVTEGELVISEVKAAGKPLPEAECSRRIVRTTNDQIVLQGDDGDGKVTVTYTRVR